MKVFAINGSPKEDGNTGTALKVMQKVFEEKWNWNVNYYNC